MLLTFNTYIFHIQFQIVCLMYPILEYKNLSPPEVYKSASLALKKKMDDSYMKAFDAAFIDYSRRQAI